MPEINKRFSKHNIFSRIYQSNNYLIANLLTGNADILDPEEAKNIQNFLSGKSIPVDLEKALQEKQYLLDETSEKKLFNQKYLDFIDSRDKDEIQLFFVPCYDCNFRCSYCYQSDYVALSHDLKTEVTDAFFEYLASEFAGRKKYLTLFGGEPLLDSTKHKNSIVYFLKKAKDAGLETAIVTNGYTLAGYVQTLKNYEIREIQITLDGTRETHNSRRILKNGMQSFDKIVEGLDACLHYNIPVNLRMVVDRENISELAALASFAIDKKWTSSHLFKTQIGRNYELHTCQSTPTALYSRLELWIEIFGLIKKNPHILDFLKPSFSFTKFLSENDKLPDPIFDSCPACKTEWAFDHTGKIFACTAMVGKAGEELGSFFPLKTRHTMKILEWENRDVKSITECTDCAMQLACGGGCGAVAKNKTGSINKPDCRPIKELAGLGFKLYGLEK